MHEHVEHVLPQYEDDRSHRAICHYIHGRYLIEALKASQPGQVSILTAWLYGQKYLSVWRESYEDILAFYQRDRESLISFQRDRVAQRLNRLMKEAQLLKTADFRRAPVTQATASAIRSACSDMGLAKGIQPFDIARMTQLNSRQLYTKNAQSLNLGQRNAAYSTPLETIDVILRGNFNNFMSLNKENDNIHAKHHLGADRFEVLDDRIYEDVIDVVTDGTFMYLPFSILQASIIFHAYIPMGMHPMTLDRMYEKYIQRHDKYLAAVSAVRGYSGVEVIDALCSEDLNICLCGLKRETAMRDLPQYTVTPDSLVERFLVMEYLLSQCTHQ